MFVDNIIKNLRGNAKMEKETKKVAGAGGVALVTGAALGFAGAGGFVEDPVDMYEAQLAELVFQLEESGLALDEAEALVAEYQAKVEELEGMEPEVIVEEVEKIVEVKVDNENLQLILDHLHQKDGDVSYLLDDLMEDEVDQIVDRILLLNEVESNAGSFVISELGRFLERRGDIDDRRDISRIRIDYDSFEYVYTDFYDNVFELTLELTARYDGDLYNVEVEVEYYRGEYYIIDVTYSLI